MDVHVTDLPAHLQALFTADADHAAEQAGLCRRHRKVTPAAFAQGLVFGWLEHPDATSAQLVAALARAGVPIRPQSLDARFTPAAADFFRRLLDRALARVVAPPGRGFGLLGRFAGVYLIDTSSVPLPAALADRWPGCGGRGDDAACRAAVKVAVRFDVSAGVVAALSVHAGKTADAATPAHTDALPAGSLRLADLAFFDLDVLADGDRAGSYYLTRVQSGSVVYDGRGRKWALAAYLARQRADRIDRAVWLGAGKRLAGRLLAIRAPAAVAARRRDQARETATAAGSQVRDGTLVLCGWTVFFTNVPRWLLTLQEAWVLYRVRWQVELLFKLWKSDGRVDESRSDRPDRVLCEVVAKLLGMVVQHWLLLACDGAAMGPTSRRQAAGTVRGQIGHVAAVLGDAAALAAALATLAAMVAAAAPVAKRRGRPATYQTLLDPYDDGLSAEAGQDPRQTPSFDDDP